MRWYTAILLCCIILITSCGPDRVDPGSEWEKLTAYPGPISLNPNFASINGKGYVIHNFDVDKPLSTDSRHLVWEFDPAGGTWNEKSAGTHLPSMGSFTAGGKLYLLVIEDPNSETQVVRLHQYDPAADLWQNIGEAPFPPASPGSYLAIGNGNKGYIISNQSAFWEYNADTNQWRSLPQILVLLEGGYPAFIAANKLFILADADDGVWSFDLTTEKWNLEESPRNDLGDFDVPRFPSVFQAGNKVYITGGLQDEACEDRVIVYDVGNKWYEIDNIPSRVVPRWSAFSFQLNGEFYIGGGMGCPSQYSREVWKYTPVDLID